MEGATFMFPTAYQPFVSGGSVGYVNEAQLKSEFCASDELRGDQSGRAAGDSESVGITRGTNAAFYR